MDFTSVRFPLAVIVFSGAVLSVVNSVRGATATATVGQAVIFTVTEDGTPPFSYQWYKDNAPIPGATAASYSVSSVGTADAGTYYAVIANLAGSTTSDDAVLMVMAATGVPVFTTQPASQTVNVGASVTFTAAASGSPTPTLQWQKGGMNIAGAVNTSYAIASVAVGDASTYAVVATNSAGSVTSSGATLTVTTTVSATAPAFTTQPASQTAITSQSATFSVAAGGNPAPTFQWQRLPAGSTVWENLAEGGSYHGVNTATLTVGTIAAAMAGDQFRCLVSNSSGSATSANVALSVSGGGSGLIQYPASIAEDTSGNLYVADASGNTVEKITPAGAVSTLAGLTGLAGSQDGAGSNARFNQPSGVAVDASGSLYVADTGNATIRKITPDGMVSTLAGSAARGNQDGVGSTASFKAPAGIAVDNAGNLYVADAFNATIRKITSAGSVSTLAGSAGSRGDADGTGAAAQFNYPSGVAVDTAGNVYVADTYNNTIRKINPTGVVTTLAGSAGISGANDGTGIYALFNQPSGIAVDSSGNIGVADTGNATIRRIAPNGAVITLAGVGGIAGLANGAGGAVLFNQPHGLVADSAGNLFVADTGNAAIRKIAPDGTVTTLALTAAPTGSTSAQTPSNNPIAPPVSSPATGAASEGGGGGGGTMESWFVLVLAFLAACRNAVTEKREG
jgi:sugar lactone lactonase YvrE